MIRQTFCHIQGIGPATERKIWKKGVRDWAAALEREDFARWHGDVAESQRRFDARDWNFFDRAIPASERWRAFADLGHRALYVDIETDGGTEEDSITVIGCFDGREARTFVRGRDLEKAKELIEEHPLIVTFNGALFDMPMIRRRFMYNLFNHVHVDLRFALRRIGFSGGLKSIEQQVGIERCPEARGLDGWDAVRLWREFEHGSEESLEVLLAYNREDIKNLMPLMKKVFEELGSGVTGAAVAMPVELKCRLIGHGSAAYDEMVKLRDEVLRKPLGLVFAPDFLEREKQDTLLGCYAGERIVGCCILTATAPHEPQLRQMAVAADCQKKGVGRVLIEFAEAVARARGAKRMFMHARKSAAGFYEKLGYKICGPEFTEVSLPHFEMDKKL